MSALPSEVFLGCNSYPVPTVALHLASLFGEQSCWHLKLRKLWLSLETEELRKANRLKGIEKHSAEEDVSKNVCTNNFAFWNRTHKK